MAVQKENSKAFLMDKALTLDSCYCIGPCIEGRDIKERHEMMIFIVIVQHTLAHRCNAVPLIIGNFFFVLL